MSSPSPLYRLATQHSDEHYKRKHSESFLNQLERTIWVSRHRTLITQYFHLGVFFLKSLFMYSFTILRFRQLPTEIVIFINVCYQINCFSGDSIPFFGVCFANVPPTVLISCEVQTWYSKTLKYS